MTLKEKFKQWLDTEPRVQIREVPLETIADEYAIGFSVWIEQNFNKGIDINKVNEFLEIYKKEKQL
jgi:hypothetical protein